MVEEMEDFSVELSIDDDGGLNLQLGESLSVTIIDNGTYVLFIVNITVFS